MGVWSERSCWESTVWFDVEETAEITGLKPDTIYHYVSRKDPKFPIPKVVRGRNHFSGEQVFRYILEHRPSVRSIVPRLFPRIAEPKPALFARAERAIMPDVGSFAIHAWQPGDSGQLIAIAYPDRRNTMHINNVATTTARLLEQLAPQIAALAIPNGEASECRIIPDQVETEPSIVVAERLPVYRRNPTGYGTARYKWSDLANLLRIDIPWWSPLLRDLDTMLSWQPGSPTTPITPYAHHADIGHITMLANENDSPAVRRAIDKLAKWVLTRLNEGVDDHLRLTPGLTQAAASTLTAAQPIPLTADEAAEILHHRADKHKATLALQVAGLWAFMPILTHTIKVDRSTTRPMARQWLDRLTDVSEDRRTELGFWFVSDYMVDSRVRPVHWLTDPHNLDTWVIQGDDAVVYAGVGTHTPDAVGQLAEAEIDDNAVFFRDESNRIWPLPDTGYCYYCTGYEGGGPQRLAETLTNLLHDATADVHKPPQLNAANTARFQALYRLVTENRAPITVDRNLLCAQASGVSP